MAMSGLSWCDFVVYTNKGIFVERMFFDTDLWVSEMFPKLKEFYFNDAARYLLSKDLSTKTQYFCGIGPTTVVNILFYNTDLHVFRSPPG